VRDSHEILKIVLDKAKADDRIRGVMLTGSRADPSIPSDKFQDYDIICLVKEPESFLSDQGWLSGFGEKLIMQIPEQMEIYKEKKSGSSIHFLMLFEDWNRIDITLVPVENRGAYYDEGNPLRLLLDKDNLPELTSLSVEKGHLIEKPLQKEFLDTCNEFWWVSTYVAKGLAREEISYGREMFEIPVRSMFMKMIAWHIGINTSFSVSFGKSGRFMKKHLSGPVYEDIMSTYADGNTENIWNALFRMADLFAGFAKEVAECLGFYYNLAEEQQVRKYLAEVREQNTKTGIIP
jgi:aminoglycoside 6-adenylyltransferase